MSGSRFLHDILQKALWEVIKFVIGLLLAALAALFSVQAAAQRISALAPYAWQIAILASLSLVWMGLALYGRLSRHRPHFARIPFDFTVLEKTITYDATAQNAILYTREYELESRYSHQHAYSDKFHWTGTRQPAPVSMYENHMVVETTKRSVWRYFEIRLPHHLRRGERVRTGVKWVLDDSDAASVPFISTTVEEPTKLLRMKITLPDLRNKKITREVCPSIGVAKPFESTEVALDSHGQYTWEIHNPKLLHYYELRWYRPQRQAAA